VRFLLERLGAIADANSGEEWQGARLAAEAERGARRLAAAGVERGDRVVIRHGGSPAFFADLFAAWRAGACAVCLNPGTTDPELANLTAFVEAKALLSGAGQSAPNGVDAPNLQLAGGRGREAEPAEASALDDDALILFTSGTTGAPKGVLHTFRSLLARVALNQAHVGAADLARTLCVLPTHFGHGLIGNCLTPLLAESPLLLGPPGTVQGAAQLSKLIDAERITFMSSVPSYWKLALKVTKPPVGATLRRVHVGSAPLSSELWRQIGGWAGTDQVVNMYGITETANWLAGASARDGGVGDGRIGRMWGGAIAVLGADGAIRAHGEGEILVQSASLMKGYFRRPDLTEAVLRDGWFHTGDIGRIDVSGEAWLTGRAKYEINRGGLKVHPEDIDVLLERHPSVHEACAFSIPDDVAGEAVGVAVQFADGATVEPRALKAWGAERLAREKLPDRWWIVDEIPKTDRGKVNRDVVAKACLARKPSL
jgi:acyl-CoA synthetase (AMP-forming)/AMP-acid ligase II